MFKVEVINFRFLKMEAASFSEPMVFIYHTTRRNTTGNRNLIFYYLQISHVDKLRTVILKTEAAVLPETLVSVYQTRRRHMSKVRNFNSNHRDNLKSHVDRYKVIHTEDGGSRFLRSIGIYLRNYTMSHARLQTAVRSSDIAHSFQFPLGVKVTRCMHIVVSVK
jgi:hypothetical protein